MKKLSRVASLFNSHSQAFAKSFFPPLMFIPKLTRIVLILVAFGLITPVVDTSVVYAKKSKKDEEKERAKAKAEKEAKEKAEEKARAKAKAEKEAKEKAEAKERAEAKAKKEAKERAEEKARAQAKAEKEAREKAEEKARAAAKAEKEAQEKAEEKARAAAKAAKDAQEQAAAEAAAKTEVNPQANGASTYDSNTVTNANGTEGSKPQRHEYHEVQLKVTHHPQEERYYCGIAVAQMWIETVIGKLVPQKDIAPWNVLLGVDSYKMEELLEKWTNKQFSVVGLDSEQKARERIYKELVKQGRPLAISGTTTHANGDKRPGGHWLLIYGVKMAGKDENYKVESVQIMDPLYKSEWQSDYETVSPDDQISAEDLFSKYWMPFANGDRQAVDD